MSTRLSRSVRPGFTLVELLVVIAIIGVLVALLLPAVQAAREAARRSSCSNNLKQIGLALHNYHDVQNSFPPGKITPGPCCGTQSMTSWTIAILPFIEQSPLYDQYDQNVTNEHPNNQYVREQSVATYQCPSDLNSNKLERPGSGPGNQLNYRHGSYRGVGGSAWDNRAQRISGGGWWDDCANTHPDFLRGMLSCSMWPGAPRRRDPARMRDVIDGTSNTLMVGEQAASRTTNRGTFWAYSYTSYNTSDAYPQSTTLLEYNRCGTSNQCKRGWGSFHPGGLQFCLGDASVRFISETIDIYTFCNMATMAGQEVVQVP